MRLLLVPDSTAPNGVDALCAALAKRAAARGHEAAVQMVPNGPLEATMDQLAAAGFASGADAVLINSLQPAALLAAKAAGKRTALRLIDTYAEASPQALSEIKRLALGADVLLVPSLYLEQIVRSWGANGGTRQVPYAYEHIMAQQIAVVTVRASRPQGFQLVAGGALNAATQGAFETLLSAVARLRIDCHLSLFGDGPALPALQAKAQQLVATDKVTFLGSVPHAKLMEYLRGAKAYVDPWGMEGYPMMALHALSEGCPVIAARCGAVPELIADGENGLLFPPGNAIALSEAVITLSSVRGLSLKLIGGGIKTVEQHSWDRTCEAVFSALEALR